MGIARPPPTTTKMVDSTRGLSTLHALSGSPAIWAYAISSTTVRATRERMSSTKAAATMSWPKAASSWCTSPSILRAIPTLVGARLTPTDRPMGQIGKREGANAHMTPMPVSRGRSVPTKATTVARAPTVRSVLKSTWSPDSKIMSVTPKTPASSKTLAKGTTSARLGPRSTPVMISPMTAEMPRRLHTWPAKYSAQRYDAMSKMVV
mmetsp:Transcript_22905/g.62159  ORF Transcript_22905/g.62159 Transcript_22905/m.62159 type:complete len:207 (+) Transcript_22905:749-1369(+)